MVSPTAVPFNIEKLNNTSTSFQYQAYIDCLEFGAYTKYLSQIGVQGMFFSVLDKMIPISPREKLQVFYAFTSLLSALALTGILLWFNKEFGFIIGLFILGSAIFSQWLVVFGRNLWWSIWAFYLPMLAIMCYMQRNRASANGKSIKFGAIVFITIFIKCLFNGYEYITTTVFMMMVPFVYYSVRDKFSLGKFLKGFLTAMFSSCIAILISLVILCIQIAAAEGSFMLGVHNIEFSLQKRTHADSKNFPSTYAASLEAGTAQVVVNYFRGIFFNPNNTFLSKTSLSSYLFPIRYSYLIFMFYIMSVFLWYRRNRYFSEKEKQRSFALVIATWFSFLAPLSWFIIFKAHSFVHPHMNYLVWQMPFTLFGFAVFGLAVKSAFSDLIPLMTQKLRG